MSITAKTQIMGAFAALCAFGLSACGAKEAQPELPIHVEGTSAAIVNGENIYLSDAELEAVARGLIAPGDAFGPENEQYKPLVNELIEQKLMAQEALARGLDADPSAARRLQIARERILGNLLVENIVATEVNEARIDQVYADQVAFQQSNDEVSVAHILLDTEAEANDVYDSIQRGSPFEALALSLSKDTTTRMKNGDLGYVAPNDQPDPFPLVIAETGMGEVSKPFETDRGWHILKVKDRRTKAPKSREEMRPEIVTFLTLREINKIVRELKTKATIQQGMPGTTKGKPAPETENESGQPL